MHLLGIHLIGFTNGNLRRIGLTVLLVLVIIGARYAIQVAVRSLLERAHLATTRFWVRQSLSLLMTFLLVVTVLSIWFDDTAHVATFLGLFSAGVAFALQKVITAWAGYFVILRGNSFTQGDRISLGNVRGDVMAVNFTQTQIMEMGEPSDDDEGPHSWVKSRQFTGRVVTISNARIFDEAVFNYTRDFPFIWDELHIMVRYQDDMDRVERIMLDIAHRHVRTGRDIAPDTLRLMHGRYGVDPIDLEPRVFWRITSNWLDLALRFVYEPHGVRAVKDRISREIVAALREAEIDIASATYDIVGFPPVSITSAPQPSQVTEISTDHRGSQA